MAKGVAGTLFGAIHLDNNAGGFLHVQLYQKLRELILDGILPGEQRLPSSRVLAEELGISRTTVLTVYDRLTSEGLVYSKTGAGSYVSGFLAERQQALENVARTRSREALASPSLSKAFESMYERLPVRVQISNPQAFSTAIPAMDLFPMELWSRLIARYSRRRDLVRYVPSKGYEPLLNAIAAHLRTERGLECDPRQVFITSGAQEAFHFLSEILLDPGDRVWFENPGSRVARYSFSARGARMIAVPVDEEGLDVSEACRLAPEFKLASVTPSHQQPKGSIMSLSRRVALLNAADRANAWIIEDDFDGEFFYARQPLPTLFSIARSERVIYVGTFSKSMFPSLRLGYFVVPEHLVERLNRAIGNYLPAVPLLLQAAVAEFIEQGHFAKHIRRAKRAYRERYQALVTGIETQLQDYLDLLPTATGFHALARFKPELDERDIAERAMRQNILLRPLGNYCLEPLPGEKGVALGFGCVSPEEIDNACRALRPVFDEAFERRLRNKP